MTNVTIADLPSGSPAQTTDLIEIQRGANGAGSGRNVSLADVVALAMASGNFTAAIGDGSAASFAVAHNLNTRDVRVEVYRNATPWDTVIVDVARTDANTITISGFATSPSANQFRVLVSAV